ncbi:MAG TPA: hypothetical protein VGZ26_12775 [Pirellulales bacterium]|jgi:hypothetical protein|nr:hypothetical protein [Pirellulales bacterium]
MQWLGVILLIFSPALIYGALLAWVAVYRGRCPCCNRRGVHDVGGYKWDGMTPDGKRCGGAVTFRRCEKCGFRIKRSGAEISQPTDEEWKRFVREGK